MLYRATWLLLACLAGTACGDRTGVIVEVTRDPATTDGVAIDKLRFFVGVQAADTPNRITDFINSTDGDEVSVSDRDLVEQPFKMMFTPKQVGDMGLTVAVVGMAGGEPVAYGQLDGEVQFLDGRLLSFPVMLYGTQGEVVVTTTGCLVVFGEDGDKTIIAPKNDQDCDDDPVDVDCDDNDPTVGPSSPERCFNQRDDDCDGEEDEQEDRDGDQVLNCDDCDDNDPDRFPGNPEVCDAKDNDCNDICDDGPLDRDGDRFTVCGTRIRDDGSCGGPSDSLIDCNDEAPSVHPGADDICDGVDNDCNEVCDDDWDRDGDMYTECGSKVSVCNGTSTQEIDCEPDDEDAYPGNRPELCDGVDNDCDGAFYPGTVPCYVRDNSGGGGDECKLGSRTCGDAAGMGWTSDCEASVNSEVVPDGLCTAYDACDNTPDPFACANGMVTAVNYSCTLSYPASEPSQVCRPNGVTLTNTASDGASCRWLLTSLGFRAAYAASLGADLDDVGPAPTKVFDECVALFGVLAPNVTPPTSDGFLVIQLADGNQQQILRLNITPQAVTTCPPNGLTCNGLVSPAPDNP